MVAEFTEEVQRLLVAPDGRPLNFTWVCPTGSTLTAFSSALQTWVVCAIGCKRWRCSVCGRRKVKRLAMRTEKAQPNRLLTVTTWPLAHAGPRAAYDNARKSWSTLVQRIRKSYGEFEYLRVLENHGNGYPHFHSLVRSDYIPQKWLSSQWEELHGSPIVDMRRIKSRQSVFWYLTKYLTKVKYIAYTNRRASWSRNFFQKEDKPPSPFGDLYQPRTSPSSVQSVMLDWTGRVAWQQITPTAWAKAPHAGQGPPLAAQHGSAAPTG